VLSFKFGNTLVCDVQLCKYLLFDHISYKHMKSLIINNFSLFWGSVDLQKQCLLILKKSHEYLFSFIIIFYN